jgi:hypothetical protein
MTMQVEFRECNFFNIWIWLEFSTIPSHLEQQYIEELLNSWFYLGKLGAFNAENLQVQDVGVDISYMNYGRDRADDSLMAVMHNMADLEFQGTWARCWFDMGTADAIALDMLVNALMQFSKDYVAIERLMIGGENEDWPIPEHRRTMYLESDFDA